MQSVVLYVKAPGGAVSSSICEGSLGVHSAVLSVKAPGGLVSSIICEGSWRCIQYYHL